jgi:hypothetical protein
MNQEQEQEQEVAVYTKPQFVEDVKKWALLDSQLKIVNEKTRKMREMKNDLSEKITNFMCDHQHEKIKLSDGEIKLYEKKEYSPLSYSYIEEMLHNIIQDEEQVEYVIQYLKDNREITIVPDIKRTYDK